MGWEGDMSTLVQSAGLANLYCIARNFGEEFNLAVYFFNSQIKTYLIVGKFGELALSKYWWIFNLAI